MANLFMSSEFGETDKHYEFSEIITLMESGEVFLDSVLTELNSGKQCTVENACKLEAPELSQKICTDIEENKFKHKIGVLLFAIGMLVVGILAVLYPDALEGGSGGRRAAIKAIISWFWGTWSGILAIIVSCLAIFGTLSKGEYEKFYKDGSYPKRKTRPNQ